MSLTSSIFWLFLGIVGLIWWLTPKERAGWVLAASSLFFYLYWFPPAAILLIAFAGLNYSSAIAMEADRSKARLWLLANILFALGALALFKYLVFIISAADPTTIQPEGTLNWVRDIVLPLGISFYTFRGLSYCVDVYRSKTPAVKKPGDYFSYLAFFPQITAGPIMRASEFIPQLANRTSNSLADWEFAIYRILRGLFLKLIISDHIVKSVAAIFSMTHADRPMAIAWAGAIFFTIQIYCDFAGYSDMAIGISRLLGFKVKENFDNPYLATSLSDFWRRWHISLSTWFRDYIYFPLARSNSFGRFLAAIAPKRSEELKASLSILIMFALSGLWHGANWTFIAWGTLHGLAILAERQTGIYAAQQGDSAKSKTVTQVWRIVTLFVVIMLWVVFRSPTLTEATAYWQSMFFGAGILALNASVINGLFWSIIFVAHQTLMAWRSRRGNAGDAPTPSRYEAWAYFAAVLFISSTPTDFIYLSF